MGIPEWTESQLGVYRVSGYQFLATQGSLDRGL